MHKAGPITLAVTTERRFVLFLFCNQCTSVRVIGVDGFENVRSVYARGKKELPILQSEDIVTVFETRTFEDVLMVGEDTVTVWKWNSEKSEYQPGI